MRIKRFAFLTAVTVSLLKYGYSDTRSVILQLLSNGKVQTPYVALLLQDGEGGEGETSRERDNLLAEVDITDDIRVTPEIGSLEPPYDQKAYLLYHVLRTTEEREKIDPEAAKTFQQTKDILRQALRKRCNKLNSCYRRCPKKVQVTCTMECKVTYDGYDVCQTIKTECYTPKCGRTMPPSWLLRQ